MSPRVPDSTSPVLGLKACVLLCLAFYVGYGDPATEPHPSLLKTNRCRIVCGKPRVWSCLSQVSAGVLDWIPYTPGAGRGVQCNRNNLHSHQRVFLGLSAPTTAPLSPVAGKSLLRASPSVTQHTSCLWKVPGPSSWTLTCPCLSPSSLPLGCSSSY